MKRIILSFCAILFPLTTFGQWSGPNQGYLTDPSGTAVADGNYSLLFKLYKDGTKVWEQTYASVPTTNGVFNVILGGTGTASLDTVAFNEPMELGVTINGGTEMTPRTPLTSAAYALGLRGMHAVTSEDETYRGVNLIGGGASNSVDANVVGATISGGGGTYLLGPSELPNRVEGNFGTVGGG